MTSSLAPENRHSTVADNRNNNNTNNNYGASAVNGCRVCKHCLQNANRKMSDGELNNNDSSQNGDYHHQLQITNGESPSMTNGPVATCGGNGNAIVIGVESPTTQKMAAAAQQQWSRNAAGLLEDDSNCLVNGSMNIVETKSQKYDLKNSTAFRPASNKTMGFQAIE
uniref:Uncharacterized protein n=1 Tax=Romanomermis culicivorax TaxID=13658 RepID=A0A915JL73_ROMCU